jgi:hypothetical protein
MRRSKKEGVSFILQHCGVTVLAQDAGTAFPTRVEFFGTLGTGVENFGWPKPAGKVTVGWISSTCPFNDSGIEYERVRMVFSPVLSLVNSVNSAANISFALETGIEMLSQSPAGEIVFAVNPLAVRNSLTTETVSGFGATNAST